MDSVSGSGGLRSQQQSRGGARMDALAEYVGNEKKGDSKMSCEMRAAPAVSASVRCQSRKVTPISTSPTQRP